MIDQDVGDRLAQALALRDRVQMVLAAGAGVGDQVVVGELGRRLEHGGGNGDAVVEGERDDHLARRVADDRQPVGQAGTCLLFHLGGEQHEDLAEQHDLLVGIVVRSGHEQVGDLHEHVVSVPARTRGEGGFDFVNQGSDLGHGSNAPHVNSCMNGERWTRPPHRLHCCTNPSKIYRSDERKPA